ncbi:hypothetical protein M153_16940002539, partial [Pseudoloma neurophilia]
TFSYDFKKVCFPKVKIFQPMLHCRKRKIVKGSCSLSIQRNDHELLKISLFLRISHLRLLHTEQIYFPLW